MGLNKFYWRIKLFSGLTLISRFSFKKEHFRILEHNWKWNMFHITALLKWKQPKTIGKWNKTLFKKNNQKMKQRLCRLSYDHVPRPPRDSIGLSLHRVTWHQYHIFHSLCFLLNFSWFFGLISRPADILCPLSPSRFDFMTAVGLFRTLLTFHLTFRSPHYVPYRRKATKG